MIKINLIGYGKKLARKLMTSILPGDQGGAFAGFVFTARPEDARPRWDVDRLMRFLARGDYFQFEHVLNGTDKEAYDELRRLELARRAVPS